MSSFLLFWKQPYQSLILSYANPVSWGFTPEALFVAGSNYEYYSSRVLDNKKTLQNKSLSNILSALMDLKTQSFIHSWHG